MQYHFRFPHESLPPYELLALGTSFGRAEESVPLVRPVPEGDSAVVQDVPESRHLHSSNSGM